MEGCEFNDSEFITAVYVGIITDTGNFEHGYYTGDTMRTVGHLLDMGVDKENVYNHIFSNFSADRIRLKGIRAAQPHGGPSRSAYSIYLAHKGRS